MSNLDQIRWHQLCRGLEARNESRWYGELARLYSEPHRAYHNAQHIADCLKEFDSAPPSAREPLAAEVALWFHDVIYDPRAADNEERSADLAEANATEGIQSSVKKLILATKRHDISLHSDAPLIVDVDLSILGQNPERFWKYEEQIRQEYEWVPQTIFAAKRGEILKQFLTREKIFHTEFFFARYEAQARANLSESIRRLCG